MPNDWKYEHEKHNRQDKAQKADYREQLQAESIARSTPEHVERFRRELTFKQNLIARYHLGLGWKLEQFANRNNFGVVDADQKRTFLILHEAAKPMLRAIISAIKEAQVEYVLNNVGEEVPIVRLPERLFWEEEFCLCPAPPSGIAAT